LRLEEADFPDQRISCDLGQDILVPAIKNDAGIFGQAFEGRPRAQFVWQRW
jgi:hypothetical protein